MKFFIPEPVYHSDEFNDLPKGVHQYKLAYIVAELSKPRHLDQKEHFYSFGCVPLSSQILKKFMGDSYKAHLDYLIEFGLIHLCEQYDEGKAAQYALNEEWLGELVSYEHEKLTFVRKLQEREEERAQNARKIHPYPCSFFNSQLQIDKTAALELIAEQHEQNLNDKHVKAKKREATAWRKRMLQEASVHNSSEGRWLLHTGEKCKRFYSVLTNMHKSLRKFLSYGGERLSEWDITNSQPLFSTILLSRKFYEEEPFNLEEVYSSNEYIKRVLRGTGKNPVAIMFPKIERYLNEPDVQKYIRLSKQRCIYEYIAIHVFNEPTLTGRDKAKNLMYQSMFCKVQFNYMDEKEEHFKLLFPNVHRAFVQFKRYDHTILALLLQNIEAKFILERCVNGLQEKFPDVPFFTIHDSFLLPESKHEKISEWLDGELSSFVGDYHPY